MHNGAFHVLSPTEVELPSGFAQISMLRQELDDLQPQQVHKKTGTTGMTGGGG